MTQGREKWGSHLLSRPDFWTVRWCQSTSYVHFYSFRTNGKNGHLDENDFRHCYEKNKVLYQQLRGTLQLQLKISLIKTWVNIMKRQLTMVPGKLSAAQKSETTLQENWSKVDDISLNFMRFFFSLRQT